METMKRALCFILSSILTFSMLSVNTFAADAFEEDVIIVYGDVNKDGKVTIADAFMLLFSKLGLVRLDDEQKFLADVDADGKTGFSDISLIFRYTFDKVDSFPADIIPLPEEPEEPDEPDQTHLLDKCYKYDEETGSYEFFIDTISTVSGSAMRMRLYVKGNKTLSIASLSGVTCSLLMDGEKYYLILPAFREYCEVPQDEIDDFDEYGISYDGEFSGFAEFTFISSSKAKLDGTWCGCEKYSSADTEYTFWFNTLGVVRMDITTEGETSVYTVNEFSPNVNDSVFTIPSGYEKINWNDLTTIYV